MTKKDLIRIRDTSSDEEVRKALRWALNRIDALERSLRDTSALARSLGRAADDGLRSGAGEGGEG